MKKVFLIVITLMHFWQMASAQYLNSGWHSPATTANNTGIGTRSWLNTSKAVTADGAYATSTATVLGQASNYLVLTNFNVNLPANAVVTGIRVNIAKTFSGLLGLITDSVVRLVKNGVITGSNYAAKGAWVYPEDTITYGNDKDLWGTTWTASNINATNFGVAISARLGGVLALTTSEVDMVELEVFYSVSLPVLLTDFTAAIQNGQALLNWSTELEINNNYFIVDRSSNGSDFVNLDTIDGHDNTITVQYYTAHDPNPLNGLNYYRLKQVDMNGNYSYSPMVGVDFENEEPAGILVYPNPVKAGEHITVRGGNYNQEATLVDMLGRSYGSYKLPAESILSISMPIAASSFVLLLLKDEVTGGVCERKIFLTN